MIEVCFAPLAGHGNPVCADLVARDLQYNGLQPVRFSAPYSSIPASAFHRGMTTLDDFAHLYTQNSEGLRDSKAAKVFGRAQRFELMTFLRNNSIDSARLHTTQEMVLDGLTGCDLEIFGGGIYQYVPDVLPKISAESAWTRISDKYGFKVRPIVWNKTAQVSLQEKGFDPILSAPQFVELATLDVARREANDRTVLVKASGSGMPRRVKQALYESSGRMPKHEVVIVGRNSIETVKAGYVKQVEKFGYDELGAVYQRMWDTNAALTITYPSEMVGFEAARHMGNPLLKSGQLYFAPRGRHELFNREFGLRHKLAAQGDFTPESSEADILQALEQIQSPEFAATIAGNIGYMSAGTIFARGANIQ